MLGFGFVGVVFYGAEFERGGRGTVFENALVRAGVCAGFEEGDFGAEEEAAPAAGFPAFGEARGELVADAGAAVAAAEEEDGDADYEHEEEEAGDAVGAFAFDECIWPAFVGVVGVEVFSRGIPGRVMFGACVLEVVRNARDVASKTDREGFVERRDLACGV